MGVRTGNRPSTYTAQPGATLLTVIAVLVLLPTLVEVKFGLRAWAPMPPCPGLCDLGQVP